jgi:hypothetical protein
MSKNWNEDEAGDVPEHIYIRPANEDANRPGEGDPPSQGGRPEPHEPSAAKPEHKVGYANPPLHTRYKKGQSGNPGGRTTKPVSFQDLFRQVAGEKAGVRTVDGARVPVSAIEANLRMLFNKGMKGDMAAVREIMKHAANLPEIARVPMTNGEYTQQEAANLTREELRAIDEILVELDAINAEPLSPEAAEELRAWTEANPYDENALMPSDEDDERSDE